MIFDAGLNNKMCQIFVSDFIFLGLSIMRIQVFTVLRYFQNTLQFLELGLCTRSWLGM